MTEKIHEKKFLTTRKRKKEKEEKRREIERNGKINSRRK